MFQMRTECFTVTHAATSRKKRAGCKTRNVSAGRLMFRIRAWPPDLLVSQNDVVNCTVTAFTRIKSFWTEDVMSAPMLFYEVHCNKKRLQWATFLRAQQLWSMSRKISTADLGDVSPVIHDNPLERNKICPFANFLDRGVFRYGEWFNFVYLPL